MTDQDRNAMGAKPLPKVLLNEVQYQDLYFYQKTEVLYAMTFHFAKRFLASKGDRTVDQMIQAARSGKQNIIEGLADGMTSTETQLKLLNVARASLKELRADYEDYLRVRGKDLWAMDSDKAVQTRRVCSQHNDPAYYTEKIAERSDETIANIAITLIHQEDVVLRKLINRLQEDFVKEGGVREKMTKARLDYRGKNNSN